ncbi:hypothetical protein GOV11_02345 [Candidatus Woesearchaeota archaeon]|nr:hypothetical protein [Candidatus Woesearchaeota archaeon]
MLGVKAPFRHAEIVKGYLLEHDLLAKGYVPVKTDDGIIFPVTREFSPPFEFDIEFIDFQSEERDLKVSLREGLKSKLSDEELVLLKTAFDSVGSIAILEIPPELVTKERMIGEALMAQNKQILTVLKKTGIREGEYRTQPLACIAGKDTRETTVIENGVRLKVDVEHAYYSIRMATERRRILQKIKPEEDILCLFSGVGPYPILFSNHSEADRIVGIEINPAAHELAMENVAKNRCTNVRLLEGDAHEIITKLAANGEAFDRITMPLPGSAIEFLDDVLSVSKTGTVIHLYAFLQEGEFNSIIPLLLDAFERNRKKMGSYEFAKAGQHAPRVWRVCVDITVD